MKLEEFDTFRIAACDLNGQMRGKRLPGEYAAKIADGAVRMPYSALNVDVFGNDIEDSPLVFETGDRDGVLLPTPRGPVPQPWLERDQPLAPMALHHEDGTPFAGDPVHALQGVLERYAERGWSVLAATELEFTLVDDSADALAHPVNPRTGRRLEAADVLSLAQLDDFDAFLTRIYDGCALMGIPAQAAISESGVGQFEINLRHQEARRAADDAWLIKPLIRAAARECGMAATFMAKPFAGEPGNGMHVHFSVVDAKGRNVFDDGTDAGGDALRSAVAGCLESMRASTLVFAPHANSYERLAPASHAPTAICWGRENRTVAVRVPGGAPSARRIEHRVAGGDANPYLAFAAMLAAALAGIEDGLAPPAPVEGNAYARADLPRLAEGWTEAVDLIAEGGAARLLPEELIANLVLAKRQEIRLVAAIPAERRWRFALETA